MPIEPIPQLRMKKHILSLITLFLPILLFAAPTAQTFTLSSPDGNQVFTFYQKVDALGKNHLTYTVSYKNQPVVLESTLDITIDNHNWENALAKKFDKVGKWFDNLVPDTVLRTAVNDTWHNPLGERSTVKDQYNGLTVCLKKPDQSQYRLNIEVRAYNEGIAFRYRFPMHPEGIYHRILAENTEFTLPEGTMSWHAPWAQAKYEKLPLSNWPDLAERPLTVEIKPNLFACLTEACQVDFPRAKFGLSASRKNTVVTVLDGFAEMVTNFDLPWRVVMAADRMGALLENNDLLLNLNPASRLVDADWIKPGKIMRETTLTTENALACIDFCTKHHMQYILFDWKWYGPAFDFASDASKVVIPALDMPKVIAYGKSKGVGVWLYVNQQALQTQADRIFPIYRQWGVAGVKFGFVEFTSQHWSEWVHQLVRKAAENHLMVNIHDEYRPTGNQRTYPNLLSAEGIRGNEEFPSATHNTLLPFTRGIAGTADYTVCYFDPRLKKTTHAHQLALPVIFFNPLQTLYWYDSPKRIVEVPELEFFDNVPTVWDETKVIHDKMGQYVSIARRQGLCWWYGSLCGDEPQQTLLPLHFLDAGKNYVATVYVDDETVQTPTKVGIVKILVNGKQILNIGLKAMGGCAIRLEPATKESSKGLKKYRGETL